MEQTGMTGEAKFINGAFSAVAAHLLPVDLPWQWLLHHHHHPHPPPPSLLSPTFHSTWPRWSYATLPNLINVAFDHLGAPFDHLGALAAPCHYYAEQLGSMLPLNHWFMWFDFLYIFSLSPNNTIVTP